jgi:uncharacterized membrane-anchored protein
LLFFFNSSILKKEQLQSDGKLILLELAPVDPRSLMQGDYMRLSYKIAQNPPFDSSPKRGYCVVKLQPNGVAERVRLQKERMPLNDNEYIIEYTLPEFSLNIGAESYFFEEGQSKKYEKARYGGVRIDKEGNSLLTGLYDDRLKHIQ